MTVDHDAAEATDGAGVRAVGSPDGHATGGRGEQAAPGRGIPGRRPVLVVLLVIAAVAVPASVGGGGTGSPDLGVADMASVVLAAVVLGPLLTTEGHRRLAGDGRLRSPVLLGLLAVLAAASMALLVSSDLIGAATSWARTAQTVAVALAVYVALRDRTDLGLLVWGLVGLAAVESALGVVQFVTATGAGFGERAVRGIGTFSADAILALAAVATLGFVVALAMALGCGGRTRLWASAATVVTGAGVIVSLSRGFWIAATVAAVVTAAAVGRRRLAAGIVLTLVVALLAVTTGVVRPGGTLGDRLDSATQALTQPDQSVQDRYALWGAAITTWSRSPVLGAGLRGFDTRLDQTVGLDFTGLADVSDARGFRRVPLTSPHNRYLFVLAERGVVGLAAMLALYGGALVAAVQRLRRGTDDRLVRTFGAAMVGATTVELVSWTSDDGFGPSAVLGAVVLGGLLWFASGRSTTSAQPARSSARAPLEHSTQGAHPIRGAHA